MKQVIVVLAPIFLAQASIAQITEIIIDDRATTIRYVGKYGCNAGELIIAAKVSYSPRDYRADTNRNGKKN